MTQPVTSEKQITPRWLTSRLLENRHLNNGRVVRISKESFSTHFSRICRLEVVYSRDASPTLPANMLLKCALPESDGSLDMGKVEVAAYLTFSGARADFPIVPCFDAVHSSRSNRSHILMEDLSPTHFQPAIPIPPSRRHCELSVQALALFHSFGWQHPGLGTSFGELLDQKAVNEIVVLVETGIAGVSDYLGDALSPLRRSVWDRSLRLMAEFWARRLTSTNRNTLIHGDAHLWNFLHPKDPAGGRAYLIDLGTCNRIRPPTNDLAYMMALQWYPERRLLMEVELLKCYHERLISLGVRGYAWDDCLLDYRYSVITHLFTPVFQWSGKSIPATVWWHNLDRIFEAYDDLHCEELL